MSFLFFFSTYKSFSPQVNIFIHYPDAAISLTPYTKLTRKAEKYWLLPRLAPAKMNSLTSEHGVLLDWICLPACLCQSQGKKKKKPREGKEEESFALPDAHFPLRRDKRKSQRVQGSKITAPLSSPHLPSLQCSLAWQIYIVRSFKAGVKRTYCGF